MENHPLVPVIRQWLLFALLLLLCAIWPECALGVFPMAFMSMGGCGGGCTIYSDDFTVDNLASDYTVVSGSWSVGGGVLSTFSASARINANTASSVAATAVQASVSINCASSGDIGRLYLADWRVEIKPGATDGTMKLFDSGGTQQEATQTIAGYTSGAKTVSLCMAYGQVIASAGSAILTHTAAVPVASVKVGLGTGAGSSSVTFDDLTFKKHHKDDSTCTSCPTVLGGGCGCADSAAKAGTTATITVSGVVDGTCTGCGALNAAYVVTCCDIFPPPMGSADGCGPWWGSQITGFCGGNFDPVYSLGGFPSGNRSFAAGSAGWTASNPGCSNTMNPNGSSAGYVSGTCDTSGSSAVLS